MAKIYVKNDPRPVKKRYGKLVWHINGQSITIIDNTEWYVLQSRKMKLKKEPQYASGKLRLHYQFTKT